MLLFFIFQAAAALDYFQGSQMVICFFAQILQQIIRNEPLASRHTERRAFGLQHIFAGL